MKFLIAIILLTLFAATILWERGASSRLRAENESLAGAKLEAEQLAAENQDLPKLRAAAPAPEDRSGNRELLRLRNEVRQLREQQQEAEKLRAANQRIAEEIKSGKYTPRRLADMEGAVPREKWTHAGFATPEAAIQSFFTAVASGQPEQVLNCMSPRSMERMKKQMNEDPERFRDEFAKAMEMFGKVSGFRIVETRSKDGALDRLEAMVQVAADGETMPLPLRRVGNEWRFDD